jgi:hypothetical protein
MNGGGCWLREGVCSIYRHIGCHLKPETCGEAAAEWLVGTGSFPVNTRTLPTLGRPTMPACRALNIVELLCGREMALGVERDAVGGAPVLWAAQRKQRGVCIARKRCRRHETPPGRALRPRPLQAGSVAIGSACVTQYSSPFTIGRT